MTADPYLQYWSDCISEAGDECCANLTPEQVSFMAEAVQGAHECYGMAFYSPPATDRIAHIEREWKQKYQELERKYENHLRAAENTMGRALGVDPQNLIIGTDGSVKKYGGRVEDLTP